MAACLPLQPGSKETPDVFGLFQLFQIPESYQNMLTLSKMFELGVVKGTFRIKRRTIH